MRYRALESSFRGGEKRGKNKMCQAVSGNGSPYGVGHGPPFLTPSLGPEQTPDNDAGVCSKWGICPIRYWASR